MARHCPDCDEPMQQLLVDGAAGRGRARGPDVELDRCPKCGGVWFDFGEPESLSRRALPFEPLADAATSRRCPTCRLTLTPGTLPDVTTVEVCTACRGAWFDREDLAVLRSTTLEALAPAPTPPAQLHLGFVCAKCGKAAQWAEANGTARGLVCTACVPRIAPEPLHPLEAPDWTSKRSLARFIVQVVTLILRPARDP